MDNTINLKLVVFGEAGVGKTSLINYFMGRKFPEQYLPTIGSKTSKKEYVIKENDKILRVLLSVWDTGGQRSFNPFNPSLYKNIDITLLVFDLTRPKETLNHLKEEYLEKVNNYSADVLNLFIGNKLDLISDKKLIKTYLQKFLAKHDNVIFISSKTGENVNECFELLLYTFLKNREIKYPDIVYNNITTAFLNLINKKEKALKARLINLNNLEFVLKKQKTIPKVKKKHIIEKKVKELKYYDFLKQELERNATQKGNVMDQFLINLSELDKTIKFSTKTSSKSVKDLINKLKEVLIAAKQDFEQNIDLITKLNREEFELMQIISKTKEEQLKQNN